MSNFQGIISDEHKHIESVPLAAALNQKILKNQNQPLADVLQNRCS